MAIDLLPGYLAAWRGRLGYTQVQVADALGVTQPMVGRWERGLRNISLEHLFALADFYGIPVTALLRHPNDVTLDDLVFGEDAAFRAEVRAVVRAYLEARKK